MRDSESSIIGDRRVGKSSIKLLRSHLGRLAFLGLISLAITPACAKAPSVEPLSFATQRDSNGDISFPLSTQIHIKPNYCTDSSQRNISEAMMISDRGNHNAVSAGFRIVCQPTPQITAFVREEHDLLGGAGGRIAKDTDLKLKSDFGDNFDLLITSDNNCLRVYFTNITKLIPTGQKTDICNFTPELASIVTE